ncbi:MULTISPECIES: urea transporter [unclassified Francisella]|uniref:urea transporter n=1 Tax=unclassified Francisella TaxID=2610885 RepID=UPI002E303BFA|nr:MULTISPECIES: urea transporter [unclassified Francisella]MED7820165.1 urea transporter [Francisella sp. 19S2-4]MED7830987.1 urea transporter [Francisella sp. 19S2-10]
MLKLKNFLKPYSSVLFLDSKLIFVVILLSLFISPSMTLCGIIAILVNIIFIKLIDISNNSLISYELYFCNALLVGLAIGYILPFSIISICLVATLSVLTFITCYIFTKIFARYQIPILSLPFSIIAIICYIASIKFLGFNNHLLKDLTSFDINLPIIISSFLKALGSIFFLPSNIVGLVILFVIFVSSRIIFLTAILSYIFGIYFEFLLSGSLTLALNDLYAFNYILTGVALYGILLIPTFRSFVITLFAIASTVIITNMIEIILNYYATPVFTLPFSIVTIAFIFTLKGLEYKDINHVIKSTPEKSFLSYLSRIYRFGKTPKINLPFSGEWHVYQGFNDKWTHKGKYQFAYDFVKKENTKTYIGDQNSLESYICFGESILSPVEGYIVDCRHDLIDNSIGNIDRANNWGNYITIKNHQGLFIKICHIMQFSLNVKVGDYVYINDALAKCGNSGHSPEPHIHIQVQNSIFHNAETINFCFDKYYIGEKLYFNTIPKRDTAITSVIIDNSIKAKFGFILDDKFTYSITEDKGLKQKINFIVKMNNSGQLYFEDDFKNKLYFYNDLTEFYFYSYCGKRNSYLQKLFILAPRIPYINKNYLIYNDYIPIDLIKSKLVIKWLAFICILNSKYAKISQNYALKYNSILSEKGKVKINLKGRGFEEIRYDESTLKLEPNN